MALLDTFVAVVSGLIIFPACFTYNVEAGAGPKLIFVTLPNVFNHMQEADFGERCFLSSCLLQLCPRCWRSLRISWLAAGIYLAGAEKKLA